MEPNYIPRDMINVELHALGTENTRLHRDKAALLEALESLLRFAEVAPQSMGAEYDVIPAARAAIAHAKWEGGK